MRVRVAGLCALLALSITACSGANPPATAANAASPAGQTAIGTKAGSGTATQPVQTAQTTLTAAPAEVRQAITASLRSAKVDSRISDVMPTGMNGLYWVTFEDMPPVYASADGKYLFQGEMLQIVNGEISSGSAKLQQAHARRLLSQVRAADMVTFPATGPKRAQVFVFTDIDCGYCRKLHSEIQQINSRGIEVHYLAWPRSEESVAPMEAVWCSKDRRAAMTRSKLGLPVQVPRCSNPVLAQRTLGMQIGVQGTPAIFNEAGEYLGGYLPAAELAGKLGL